MHVCTLRAELSGTTWFVYCWSSQRAFLFSQQTNLLLACCCVHGRWCAIAYTARIVFSAPHGDAEYTRRTDLCNARITTIRGYALAIPSCAHATALKIWAAHVFCQGSAAVRLPIKITGEVGAGCTCRVNQWHAVPQRPVCRQCCRVGGPQCCASPTVIDIPSARTVMDKHLPSQIGAPESVQSQRTSTSHILDNTVHTSWTWLRVDPTFRLKASRILSLNWQRLNHN